ncbi:MAG: methyltransferase domain-containing protein [Candidatus Glassbacteria bacterium]
MGRRPENSSGGKRKFFDRHAEGWEEGNCGDQAGYEELVRALGLAAGDTVVEPGCGTGLVSSLILNIIGPSGRLFATDISSHMLTQAEKKNLPANVSFHLADAACLPFPDECADSVVCFRVFPHIDNQVGALDEFRRVLKKDGRLVIAHSAGRARLNDYHARVGGEVADDMLPDRAELAGLLAAHGFDLQSLEDRSDRYLALAVKQ